MVITDEDVSQGQSGWLMAVPAVYTVGSRGRLQLPKHPGESSRGVEKVTVQKLNLT